MENLKSASSQLQDITSLNMKSQAAAIKQHLIITLRINILGFSNIKQNSIMMCMRHLL